MGGDTAEIDAGPRRPLRSSRSRTGAPCAGAGPVVERAVRLTHRIQDLVGSRSPTDPEGRPDTAGLQPAATPASGAAPAPIPAALAHASEAPSAAAGGPIAADGASGPGTAGALPAADPCAPARSAVEDACSLADRMNALSLAAQERLRDARRQYDEHAGRRERAAAAADPRVVRAAKDEAQATFRRTRLAARDRVAIEGAAA